MVNMRKKLQKEINTPFILHNDQDSDGANTLKDLKNIIIKSMPRQDGGLILRSHGETCRGIQHIRPRQLTMVGSRTQVGILGDHHPGLNSCDFFVQRCLFACWKMNSLAIDGWCRQTHLPHATFSHVQTLHRTHSTDNMCAWLTGLESS